MGKKQTKRRKKKPKPRPRRVKKEKRKMKSQKKSLKRFHRQIRSAICFTFSRIILQLRFDIFFFVRVLGRLSLLKLRRLNHKRDLHN
jgi:hypothetical protein